jgi:hypothetical protein
MNDKLSTQVKILQWYAGILTLVVAALAVYVIRGSRAGTVDVLTAHRINIVEPDGALKLVISNAAQQDPGADEGKEFSPRQRPAGMVFFNDEGSECGGLVYDGSKKEASFTLSVDQYRNDQIMQMQYQEDSAGGKRTRSYGVKMWERRDDLNVLHIYRALDSLYQQHDSVGLAKILTDLKEKRPTVERLYLGKTFDKEYGLFIKDKAGRTRIRIGIDSLGQVIWEKLDTTGAVIR